MAVHLCVGPEIDISTDYMIFFIYFFKQDHFFWVGMSLSLGGAQFQLPRALYMQALGITCNTFS